ncbi:hypothetical protein BS17DRAFT_787631 [Gyrodon lividus]|nr:hypothetical protein BS17DRAFT_787631 [Gyrodon lividus]
MTLSQSRPSLLLHSGIVAVKMQTLIQKATKVSGDDRCQLPNFWSTIDSRVHL